MGVSIEKAIIARYVAKGKKFEVLIDPEKALEIRRGEKVDILDSLAFPAVYRNARAAEVVSEEELRKVFGTTDLEKVVERIVKEGEIQTTAKQKRKMIEKKKRLIAELIAKRAINPQTNLPHPPQRILNCMEEVGVKIDPFLDVEVQLKEVVKQIRKILPLSFQKLIVELKFPPQYVNVFNLLKKFGEVRKQEWLGDGSLKVEMEILAGIQNTFFEKLASFTHGNFQSRIIKKHES